MKIILAPDKFKGTMTASRVAEIEAEALHSVIPDAEIIRIPLADGGDGTVQTLAAALHGTLRMVAVHDPLGRPIETVYGIAGKTAVIEMALASGMVLLAHEERNPLKTSTFGTGEVIREALRSGAETLIIGIGGSATVDGGAGMAEALGFRFYDEAGRQIEGLCGGNLSGISRIDSSEAEPLLRKAEIRIASDVTNPLLGAEGAVAVFAPQKGATPAMMPILEEGLRHLAEVLKKQGLSDSCSQPGDGAAGGLGFGLRVFCGAKTESGAQLAIGMTGLEKELADADFLITGEGCTDSQTEKGKLCSELLAVCRKHKVPCILLSGAVKEGVSAQENGFAQVWSASDPSIPFAVVKPHAEEYLREAVLKVAEKLSVR